jgi:hypothetical protein
VRVPLDGTPPSTVLAVPIEGFVDFDVDADIRSDVGPIAVDSYGEQLVFAVTTRVDSMADAPFRILVFRVDTASVEG